MDKEREKLALELTTEVDAGKIIITEKWDKFSDIYTYVLDTKEKMIREALIELGWRPPIVDYSTIPPKPKRPKGTIYKEGNIKPEIEEDD